MSTPGSRARAAGPTIMLLSASAGVHPGAGGFILLLCFAGVLAGATIVSAGVRMADDDDPAPVVPAGALALAAFLRRRHLTVVGLMVASCAVTAVSGEADPVLCFAMFVLFLLALSLINVGVLGVAVTCFNSSMH